ncbi:hypothetical protein NC652_036550 [Populus alba x Populus x berolinensis]|nr:hypothetical protein NC652_036550 [Populus alba x Populus x berolinensis]
MGWWWWGFGGAFEPLASEEGDEEGGVFPCRRVHQLGTLWLLYHEKLKTFGTQTLCSVLIALMLLFRRQNLCGSYALYPSFSSITF